MPDLTLDEIRDTANTLRNDIYAERFKEFEIDQLWYDQNVSLESLFPKFNQTDKLDPVFLPFAETYVNAFTDHMANSSRRVLPFVNPRQLEDKGDEIAVHFATLRGEMLSFFHERTNRNTEGVRPDRDTAKFLGLRGMAVKELVFDKQRQEKTGFGFDVVAHDPWAVMPDPRTRNKQFLIREYDSTLAEVRQIYGPESGIKDPLLLHEFGTMNDSRSISVTQYIDGTAFYFIVGNEMTVIENDFGFLPYVFGFNGLGLTAETDQRSMEGNSNSAAVRDRFALESRSLLKPIRNVMEHAVRMDTSLWEAIKQSIFPAGVAINMDEDELEFGQSGTLTNLSQRANEDPEDIQWRPRPSVDPNVWHGIARHQGWMDRYAGSQVLQGQSERTISSGLEFEQRLQQARLVFGEASESFIGMDIRLGEMLQEYAEKHSIDMTIAFQKPSNAKDLGSRTLKGKDFDEFYDHDIELLAPGQDKIDFQNLITRVQVAQAPGPGPTMEWALEGQEGINPKQMLRDKQLEQAKFSPQVFEVMANFAAQELNIAITEMKAESDAAIEEDSVLAAVTRGQEAGEAQSFNATNVRRQLQSTLAQSVPGQGNNGRPLVGPTTGDNDNV